MTNHVHGCTGLNMSQAGGMAPGRRCGYSCLIACVYNRYNAFLDVESKDN